MGSPGNGIGFSGTCRVTLNVPGQDPVIQEVPHLNNEFQRIDWLGVSSVSDAATVFNIDNLKLGTLDEFPQGEE